jgi:hypothetical protein
VAKIDSVVVGKGDPTNGGAKAIETGQPYVAQIIITGSSDLIFHRWNCEAVAEKAGAAKGSKAKKSDDIESYVYRDPDGFLCLPGEYLRQSIIHAAKFRQDPRSPRKSAMDLFKAGVVSLTPLARLGPTPTKEWHYEHACRVTVQRNGITRIRPAFKVGWTAEVHLACLLPEYISNQILLEVANSAGRLVGVGDNRPTYGRFAVSRFEVV